MDQVYKGFSAEQGTAVLAINCLRTMTSVEPTVESPPMLTHVLWPVPAWVSKLALSMVMPSLRHMTPTRPGE